MRLSSFAACALLTISCYGCASTLPPAQVGMDDAFAAGAVHSRRVLLLPPDVEVAIFGEDGRPAPPPILENASRNAALLLHDGTRMELARRGYQIAGELQWDGSIIFPDGRLQPVLDGDAMAQLYQALAGNQPPAPEVLARLQQVSGADALFQLSADGQEVPGESTGEKVAKDIAIGLFIVIVVVALAVMSKGKSSGGAPRLATGATRGAVHFGTPVATAAAATRVPMAVPVGHVHGPGCNVVLGIHDGFYYGGAPTPEHQDQSGLGVSMRLVDLGTPRILWSADQWAEGPPRDAGFIRSLGHNVAASLPTAR